MSIINKNNRNSVQFVNYSAIQSVHKKAECSTFEAPSEGENFANRIFVDQIQSAVVGLVVLQLKGIIVPLSAHSGSKAFKSRKKIKYNDTGSATFHLEILNSGFRGRIKIDFCGVI